MPPIICKNKHDPGQLPFCQSPSGSGTMAHWHMGVTKKMLTTTVQACALSSQQLTEWRLYYLQTWPFGPNLHISQKVFYIWYYLLINIDIKWPDLTYCYSCFIDSFGKYFVAIRFTRQCIWNPRSFPLEILAHAVTTYKASSNVYLISISLDRAI